MNRRTLLVLIAALAALIVGCSRNDAAPAASSPPKELTVDEVATRIAAKDGKFFVFDNNDKERFQKEHVPGARWVKFNEVTASDLPDDKNATLVFYCANER